MLIHANGHTRAVYALFDTGATICALSRNVVNDLAIVSTFKPLRLSTFNSKVETKEQEIVAYRITDLKEVLSFDVGHSLVGQFMTTENEIPPRNSSIARYGYMGDVILDELDDREIGLLLPAQFSRHFFKEDVRKGGEEEPIAVKTDFGWSILGPVSVVGDTDDIDFDGVNDWCDAGVNALTDVDNVDIDHIDMSRDLALALKVFLG